MFRDIVQRLGLRLVVLVGVEGELAEQVAGLGEDSDVEVVGEDEDAVPGVAAPEPDVVQPAVVAQGDRAAAAHAVLADPERGSGPSGGCPRRFEGKPR